MKTSIIKAVGGLLIVLFEIALFAYLDKSTYLHKSQPWRLQNSTTILY